jgi:type VI secretion system protein ImpH
MKSEIPTPLARLYAEPHRFDFFQAVRLIYRAHDFGSRSTPTDPGPLHFSVPASLAFPASEIDDLLPPQDDGIDKASTMRVNFMGLTGTSGVMPRHYTEWMIARRQNRDPVMQDFFDLFNTRLIQLFWRAWAKYRADIGLEFGHENSVLRYVFHLVGMGTPSLYDKVFPRRTRSGAVASSEPLPTRALGYYSGLISQRPHGIGSVSQVLGDFIGAKVEVDGCFGTWQAIPSADRARLGQASSALGTACALGGRYWDRQTTLRLRVGPLSAGLYHALLPGGTLLAQATELARFMSGIALDLHFKLQLRSADWQPLQLGRSTQRPARLGWNTWLSGDRRGRAADDCEFHLSALA